MYRLGRCTDAGVDIEKIVPESIVEHHKGFVVGIAPVAFPAHILAVGVERCIEIGE